MWVSEIKKLNDRDLGSKMAIIKTEKILRNFKNTRFEVLLLY